MYDFVVVGGGPAGYPAAIRAAQLNAKVLLVEKDELGGTCLNVGCIPSKLYLHAASMAFEIERASQSGLEGDFSIAPDKLRAHKEATIARLKKGIEGLLNANKIRLAHETAIFLDEKTLQVGAERIKAEHFLIATGSSPLVPPIQGIAQQNVWTSAEALELKTVPKMLVIVGAGFVGLEMAMIYKALGSRVTLVDMLPRLLPMLDADMAALVERSLKAKGISLVLGAHLVRVEPGPRPVFLKDDEEEAFSSDAVLLAVGRTPNLFGLERLPLGPVGKGVFVNERLQTRLSNIYAAGDVTGRTFLAHAATHQGILAAENALGGENALDLENLPVPNCLYTDPEAAWVGLSETKAKERFGDVRTGTYLYGALGRALASNEPLGKIKVIADSKDGKILGAQVVGKAATEIIHEATLAMSAGITLSAIAAAVHAHPSFSEGIKEACLEALETPLHKPPR
jgi:dihydrolipoamide dehydrogenase